MYILVSLRFKEKMKKMFYKPQETIKEDVPKPTELLRFVNVIPNSLGGRKRK